MTRKGKFSNKHVRPATYLFFSIKGVLAEGVLGHGEIRDAQMRPALNGHSVWKSLVTSKLKGLIGASMSNALLRQVGFLTIFCEKKRQHDGII